MKRIVLGAIALLLVTGVAVPEEPYRAAAGDYLFDTFSYIRLSRGDLTWSGALTVTSPAGSDTTTTFNFHAAVGYFMSDLYEVEANLMWTGAEGYSGVVLALGVNRYYGEWSDRIYPYLGASLAKGFADADDDIHLRLKAGVRHYLTRHMGLRYWLEYDTSLEDLLDLDGAVTGYVGVFAHPF